MECVTISYKIQVSSEEHESQMFKDPILISEGSTEHFS